MQQGFCERQDLVYHGESSSLSQGKEGGGGEIAEWQIFKCATTDIWDVSNSYILSIESVLDLWTWREKFYCFEVRLSCLAFLFIFCSLSFFPFSFLFFSSVCYLNEVSVSSVFMALQGERNGLTTYVWILLKNISGGID